MSKLFFDKVSEKFTEKFDEKVKKAKSIVLSSHIAPDEDSVSSVLGIHYYLTEILKIDKNKIKILYTWQQTDTWDYFERSGEIKFVDDIYYHMEKSDLIIFTDGSGWMRFSRNADIKKFKNFTICIDHHPTPEDQFDLHLVDSSFGSTAEMVYWLFFEKQKLDKEICEIILMGILGDTGNFRFVKPEQSKVFNVAERLVREGDVIVESLQNKYQNMSIEVYKILQELMKNSEIRRVEGWPTFLVSYITPEFSKEHNLDDSQISEASGGFTPYLKTLKGISWGFVITPRSESKFCHLSLRSIPGSVSVRDLMERTKFGGGHDRAAGGKISTSDPKEAIKTMEDWMAKNKPGLA